MSSLPPKPPAQALRSPPNISELDRMCQRLLQSHWATGVACLLAAPRGRGMSQLIHVGALGRTMATGGQKITKDTLFDVGSLTATLATSTVALMLMAQGRISLTTTLGQCLPQAAKGPLADRTLGALLDHSAGLPPGDEPLVRAVASVPAPVRPRVLAAGEQEARITAKVPMHASGIPMGDGPLDAATLAKIKGALCVTPPVGPQGQGAQYAPLGPLLLGWALEHVGQKPLDVLLQEWVVKPLLPKDAVKFCRNGPTGPLLRGAQAAATPACVWRHRTLVGEAHDRLAWLLGGVAGHSGLFATGDGLMRLALGLLFSLNGLVRYAHGGTLQRFWSRPNRMVETPYTPGWMVPCRQNGMVPGRWHSRTVGQVDASGSAVFIDPAFGLIGVLLVNGDPEHSAEARAGIAHVRARVFDAMASYGQNLTAAKDNQR